MGALEEEERRLSDKHDGHADSRELSAAL